MAQTKQKGARTANEMHRCVIEFRHAVRSLSTDRFLVNKGQTRYSTYGLFPSYLLDQASACPTTPMSARLL